MTMRMLVAIAAFVISHSFGQDVQTTLRNSNHIFNEIHSSARQWGSTLNHNGMGFFVANVPEGTELYHGTSSPDVKTGMDWLAFEPEHALIFARPGSNRAEDNDEVVQHHKETESFGYLHTYRTRHDLRLLYLNGASAAKSDRGTLDLQDVVLLGKPPGSTTGRRSFHEHEEDSARASAMCRLATEKWHGKVDGFVRMEAGFEIVLCDFGSNLDFVRCTQSKPFHGKPGVIPDSPGFFKAIASRYDGIGGERISIDYERHVSLFAYPGAVYFDQWDRPRANYTSSSLSDLREAVTNMVVQADYERSTRPTDWQSVTDMIVARYSDRIAHLASGDILSLDDMRFEAERSLIPFIDYAHLNRDAEVSRCKYHFIPHASHQPSTAALAVMEVNEIVCETLSKIAHSRLDRYSHALSLARALKKWLAWTEWKKCKECGYDQFCFVPLWPLGSAEDFEKPRCLSNFRDVGRDYWHADLPQARDTVRDSTMPQVCGNGNYQWSFNPSCLATHSSVDGRR